MPASVALNTYDPVLAERNLRGKVITQLRKKSAFLATIFGMEAERKANGEQMEQITVDSFEVLQRDIEIANIAQKSRIAPAASITTAISKTVPTLARTLYGSLTCDFAAAPFSLNEWIHGGVNARNPITKLNSGSIVNNLTDQMLAGMFTAGTGNDPDGLLKWTSKTANKWGLDTSNAANAYFRGQVETIGTAAFDEDLLSEWIKIACTGRQTISGTVTYSNQSTPSLGICDYNTFQRMKKWIRDKQTVNMTDLKPGQEEYRIGGYYQGGILLDKVVFFPELALDTIRDTNGSVGELFILDPEDFEFVFLKGFDFKFVSNPDDGLGDESVNHPLVDFADVVWGKYINMVVLWNMFCRRCRNQLYGQITA